MKRPALAVPSLLMSAVKIFNLGMKLQQYLEASVSKYEACLSGFDAPSAIPKPATSVRFHHLRLDGNGAPKFKELAEALVDHATQYCFSARRRQNPITPDEHARLHREARALFRKMTLSGEAGEMLLFFLLEAVLRAPQLIAKMELKTNPNMEIHGSDGIHCRWHQADNILDVYFGEAKLEKSVSSALSSLFTSLEGFHRDGLRDHEIGMVTSHFKHADESLKTHLLGLIDRQSSAHNCRVNHACLVGYRL